MRKTSLIAIIDDDASFRRATAQLVQSLGYAVAVFSSAEEFMSSGRLDETACLISDVQMPGMSGIELQNWLLAQGYRLPVIFISAYPAPKAPEQAAGFGTLGFLDKPFQEDRLISYLSHVFSDQKA